MKVSELKGDDLDYWTARADGFEEDLIIRPLRADGSKRTTVCMDDGSWQSHCYANDWRLVGPLIEKHHMYIEFGTDCFPKQWLCHAGSQNGGVGLTAQEAICRAVVAKAFGDEVTE